MSFFDETEKDKEFELTNWDVGLKGSRRKFVLYYCTDEYCFLNATRAYKKAFAKIKNGVLEEPSDKSAAETASRLFKDPVIKKAVSLLNRKSQSDEDEESARRMLRQLAMMSFYDISEIIDIDGRLKVDKLEDLGEKAKCIQGIVVTPGKYGDKVEVKLADRTKSMESFAKYLNIIRSEKTENILMPVVYLPAKQPIHSEET